MYISVLPACMHTHQVYTCCPRRLEEGIGPLELELVALSHHVGNKFRSSVRATSALYQHTVSAAPPYQFQVSPLSLSTTIIPPLHHNLASLSSLQMQLHVATCQSLFLSVEVIIVVNCCSCAYCSSFSPLSPTLRQSLSPQFLSKVSETHISITLPCQHASFPTWVGWASAS